MAKNKNHADAAAPAPTEENGNNDKPKKTPCPISRKDFKGNAKPLEVVINGTSMIAEVKEFSTGSIGWSINGKTVIKLGDVPLSVQVGLNLTIVNSKDLEGFVPPAKS